MKVTEQFYTIELTPAEIDIITTALHGEYKFIREQRHKPENADRQPQLYQKQQATQKLRNAFAELIDRRYMGEDA